MTSCTSDAALRRKCCRRERLREARVQAFVQQFGEVEDADGAAGGIHAAA